MTHWTRWRKHGDPLAIVRKPKGRCSIADCEGEHYGKGLCHMHWARLRRKGDPEAPSTRPRDMSVEDRLFGRVDFEGPGGCHLWLGHRTHNGYGQIVWQGRIQQVHRAAYEIRVGPIPEGLVIDHTCHNGSGCKAGSNCLHRRCVNPAHLEPVTNLENIQRAYRGVA